MHPRTVATLADLERVEWFRNVGVADSAHAIFLKSWDEAVQHCESLEWENFCLEASNQYREKLFVRNYERFVQWNAVVGEMNAVAIPLINRKTRKAVEANNLPKGFVNSVQWDIVASLLEAEYADVCPQGFYASLADWYVAGHFPCGCLGNFPDGKLIVF